MYANGLLEGLNVVDLGVGMAPALVSKMLAEMGAAVTRIEPEGGDPFVDIYPAHAVWHGLSRRAEAANLERLLAAADVCIIGGEDHPDVPRRRDAGDIAARHPRLVVLDIADGPAGTPYAGPSTELLAQVRSGLVWEQEPGRPIINAFDPGTYGAAMQGVTGILGALFEREGSGQGQVVSTSLFEGALPWIGTYWSEIEKPTPAAAFVIPRGVAPLIFRTRDDRFIHMAIGGAGSKYGFYQALGIDDPSVLPGDSGMPKPGGNRRDFFGDHALLASHVAKWDCDELLARIWERGLPAEEVQAPGDCWQEEQIVHNGIIVTEADGTRYVGLPFRARRLGSGGARPFTGGAPLAGVRVVDCGAFVAGPLAGVGLADLGADVVKVEALQGDPNRSIFKSFAVANRGKRAIALDMKHAEGLDAVHRLCAGADIVMNNFRPGVSARLGIDPDSLAKLNPSLVVLEAPAFGTTGPLAQKAGFDMVMQAWTGHEAKAAGAGNEPRWNRTNLVDIAGGMLGTIATLAGLLHRVRTGNGVALESPLCNAGIYTLSELVQRPDGSFAQTARPDSELRGYSPYEALYEAADGWIAIVARGERAKGALREALEIAGEATCAAIAGAIAQRNVADLAKRLESHGIWLEPCRDGKEQEILRDPALIARGTVRVTTHPAFGRIHEIGAAYTLSRSPMGNDRAAPMPGQHTREVLAGLGHDEAAIETLFATTAVA